MSRNLDHLVKMHRLRSLAELVEREPRLVAQLEEVGVDREALIGVIVSIVDELDAL